MFWIEKVVDLKMRNVGYFFLFTGKKRWLWKKCSCFIIGTGSILHCSVAIPVSFQQIFWLVEGIWYFQPHHKKTLFPPPLIPPPQLTNTFLASSPRTSCTPPLSPSQFSFSFPACIFPLAFLFLLPWGSLGSSFPAFFLPFWQKYNTSSSGRSQWNISISLWGTESNRVPMPLNPCASLWFNIEPLCELRTNTLPYRTTPCDSLSN